MQMSKVTSLPMGLDQKLQKLFATTVFQVAAIVSIMLIGLALRLFRLGEWSFWIDEIFTLRVIETSLATQEGLISLNSYISKVVISALGVSEWNGRIVAAVVGTITIPILFYIVKKQTDFLTAIITAVFLSIAPWHIYWSQNLRFYAFLFLLYTLALVAFFLSFEQKKYRGLYLLAGLILFVLAIQERLFAIFLIPVFFSYLLMLNLLSIEVPALFRLRNLIGVFITAVILFIAYDLFNSNATGNSSDIAVFFEKFIGSPNKSMFRFIISYIYRVNIPIIFLGLIGGIFSIINKNRFGILNFCAAVVPPVALAIASPFVFTVDRYAFVALASWLILSAIAIKETLSHTDTIGKLFIAGVFLLVLTDALSQNFQYYMFQNGSRPDWKTAFAHVENQRTDGDIVYATRPEMGFYYLDQNVLPVDSFVPEDNENANHKSWFVISTSTSSIRPELHTWIKENGILVDSLDVHIPGKIFDMQLYLYDPDYQK